jgi:hypothetical protein
MNWIIKYSKKMPYHTYLNVILEPFKGQIDNYNWILSDLEYHSANVELPIDMDTDYFILSPVDFMALLKANVQIWWGVILAIPISHEVKLNIDDLPFAEGNAMIWKNGNLQHPDAEIEIVCFDSGYTIVKFTRQDLSDKFKAYFDEAIELEKFK